VGGVIAPTVAGMLGDAVSPAAPFYLCAGGAPLAALACLGLIETAPAVLRRRGAGRRCQPATTCQQRKQRPPERPTR